MSDKRLEGKRVLLTQADDYMGPATIEVFGEYGAELIEDRSDLARPGAVEELVKRAGPREDALFALFLASGESDFFVGQSIAFSGGWVQ